MHVVKTAIPGVVVVEPKVFGDERGFFMELYRSERYAASGISQLFVQDSLSRSIRNTVRGLHFQNPRAQGKLITVLRGSILDVAVDIRVGSPTFGRHVAVELNDDNRWQIWIPRGCAHGFVVRSDVAEVFYKSDESYSPTDEVVLRWNDPALDIDWACTTPILSSRDKAGLSLADLRGRLPSFEPETV